MKIKVFISKILTRRDFSIERPWQRVSLSACPGFSDADNHDVAEVTFILLTNYSSFLCFSRFVPVSIQKFQNYWLADDEISPGRWLRELFSFRNHQFWQQPVQMTTLDPKRLSLIICLYCAITIENFDLGSGFFFSALEYRSMKRLIEILLSAQLDADESLIDLS